MKDNNCEHPVYTDETEKEKFENLLKLQNAWKEQISTKPPMIFPDDGKKYRTAKYFCYDGFFPGYFSHKKKVLFIGRETRWGRPNFIESSINFFANKNVNGKSSPFWYKVLCMIYGIQYGIQHERKVHYEDVPYVDSIAKEMVKNKDYGFAVMQLSKYSNDSSEGGIRNIEMINRFLEDSELNKRNFFQEELSLLDPDIIITANIWDCGVKDEYLEQCFPEEKFKSWQRDEVNNNYGDFELNGKIVKIINTYHFSSRKSRKYCFYDPVMKILFN